MSDQYEWRVAGPEGRQWRYRTEQEAREAWLRGIREGFVVRLQRRLIPEWETVDGEVRKVES